MSEAGLRPHVRRRGTAQEPAGIVDKRGRMELDPNWRPRDMELFLLKSILLIDTGALAGTFVDAFRQAAPRAEVRDGLTDIVLGLGGLVKDVLREAKVVWSPAIDSSGERRAEFTVAATVVGGRIFGR